jgi:hypothetical protein
MLTDYPTPVATAVGEIPSIKKKIKLRKINQQEKEEIFKDYYERKRELSPLKHSTKNLFGSKKLSISNLGKTEDTRTSKRLDSSGVGTLMTGYLFDTNTSSANKLLGDC